MRKLLFLLVVSFLYADISEILIEVKKIEECNAKKPYLKNIFFNTFYYKPNIDISCEEKSFKIKAKLNDKVLIGSKWYKVGDYVNGYKIVQITDKYVKFQTSKGYLKIPLYVQKVLK
jgi:hypothetical protein